MAPRPEGPFGGTPRRAGRSSARGSARRDGESPRERGPRDGEGAQDGLGAAAHGDAAPRAGSHPQISISGNPYGRWIGALGVAVVLAITVITILTKPKGAAGIEPGERAPPFAVPLVSANGKEYDANVSLKYGQAGAKVPAACDVRSAGALNICSLYEHGPVVLALFTDSESCPSVLETMQQLAPSFPGVAFVAVAVHNGRSAVRKLVAREHIALPVGYDAEGTLAGVYRLATCPQVSFIEQGGIVQSKALLLAPSRGTLRARVRALVAASEARAAAAGESGSGGAGSGNGSGGAGSGNGSGARRR